MFNNFTDDYKKLMLDTETAVKREWYREVLPQDVFLQISKIPSGNMFDLLASYGINEKIVLEVFSRSPFSDYLTNRPKADYAWLSQSLKDLIVSSVRGAASFEKKKVGIEDYLFALLISPTESWFAQFLDFIGVSPKDFEQNLIQYNKAISKSGESGLFWPLENILHALEEGFSNAWVDDVAQDPFAMNRKQQGRKEETQTPALDFFWLDLTKEAREGRLDRIIGRDKEIDRLISIINRKTKNNPCLVGEPGVGKTAVVEGLAQRISEGKVPMAMLNKRVVNLSLSSLIAGTKYRGEFEARIKQVIDEASRMENEIILFIDEIHTIIGAGSWEGTLDAANILKPAMGRGKITIVGATTLSEYQKYIEKDSALERRFQKIEVDEPSKDVAIQIIEWLRSSFEDHHNLVIEDSAIRDAVELSVRYMTDRYLPDKAIDLIDEACSAKSMTYNQSEDEVHKIKEDMEKLQKEIDGFVTAQQFLKAFKAKEKLDSLELKIKEKKARRTIPREERLHIMSVDIQRIVNQITGIPSKNLQMEDVKKLQGLEQELTKRIIWQDAAVADIVHAIKRSRSGIADQRRPIGSFLFLGPTGVGKTELVKVLARAFYGDEKALIKIDMSEFWEKSSASKLIGTTAGYVGYEEGGMLTEKVRRKPYSIVLFDEIEKGNFEIYNLLLQILEDGMITDGKGRKINFKNTIIVMTSNIGSDEFTDKATQIGFETTDDHRDRIIEDYDRIKAKILEDLDEHFVPEFINRIDKVVVFNPLDKKNLKRIISLQLDDLHERLLASNVESSYDRSVVDFILKEVYNARYGARPVRRFIQEKIEDPIADIVITRTAWDMTRVKITANRGKIAVDEVKRSAS